MKVAVVSLSDASISEYAAVARANHESYCARHDYSYTHSTPQAERPAAWYKIPTILAAFEQGFEWVLWIDADAVFTSNESLGSLIAKSFGKDLLCRADEQGLNSGVMLLKNSKWVKQLLNTAWKQEDLIEHPWWEQAAIHRLLKEPTNENHVLYLAPSEINSYPDEWYDGCRIYHAVGEPEKKVSRVRIAAGAEMPEATPVWSHSGDRGDLLAALAVFAHKATPVDFCMFPAACTGYRMNERAARGLIPLLEVQPYIRSAYWAATPQGENMDVWRQRYRGGYNLADMQTEVFGCGFYPRDKAWITVPDPIKVAKVVIQRSPRYHNWMWGQVWKSILAEYRNEIIFVGHPEEHTEFCTYIGPVPYYPTHDYLHLAQVIAGACLFVGNQSSPFWVAEAYKQLSLLEVCVRIQNCHFERPGLIYGVNEFVRIPSRNDLERLRSENDARVMR